MGYTIDRNRITWDQIDGETLIIDTESGYYFSLDGVGSLVWSMLAMGADEDAIVDRIIGEYDVDASTVREDLHLLVNTLRREQLVDRRTEEGLPDGQGDA